MLGLFQKVWEEGNMVDIHLASPIELKRPRWVVGISACLCLLFLGIGCFFIQVDLSTAVAVFWVAFAWGIHAWWCTYVPYIRFTSLEFIIPPHRFITWGEDTSMMIIGNTLKIILVNGKTIRVRFSRSDRLDIEHILAKREHA